MHVNRFGRVLARAPIDFLRHFWNEIGMGQKSSKLFDHQKLKEFLAVCLTDHREQLAKSRAEMAFASGLDEGLLQSLEAGSYEGPIDNDLLSEVTKAYEIGSDDLRDVLRVSCVAQILEVMKVLNEPD